MFPKLIRKNSAPSIRNRVLYKKGLDGDDSYLKLIIEFRKMYIFFAPKNKKKYPQKLPSKVAHNWLGLAVFSPGSLCFVQRDSSIGGL